MVRRTNRDDGAPTGPLDGELAATLDLHVQELRRGTVVLACLAVLREPGYGYALLETLDAAGFAVQGNTLYPLLRRLEAQGLLESDWNTEESRPRKFYRTTSAGRAALHALSLDWHRLDRAIGLLDTPTDGAGGPTP